MFAVSVPSARPSELLTDCITSLRIAINRTYCDINPPKRFLSPGGSGCRKGSVSSGMDKAKLCSSAGKLIRTAEAGQLQYSRIPPCVIASRQNELHMRRLDTSSCTHCAPIGPCLCSPRAKAILVATTLSVQAAAERPLLISC